MRLTVLSDYALRVLMYLGARPDRLATIEEIAAAYGISANHLMKVVHGLARHGFIVTVRGRGGGMRLARPAGEITVGEVLRAMEDDFALVACFRSEDACRSRVPAEARARGGARRLPRRPRPVDPRPARAQARAAPAPACAYDRMTQRTPRQPP